MADYFDVSSTDSSDDDETREYKRKIKGARAPRPPKVHQDIHYDDWFLSIIINDIDLKNGYYRICTRVDLPTLAKLLFIFEYPHHHTHEAEKFSKYREETLRDLRTLNAIPDNELQHMKLCKNGKILFTVDGIQKADMVLILKELMRLLHE